MSKSNAWENDLLLLVFNNVNAALIGDATGLRGSSAAGSLYLSLHTADPAEAGDQSSSEISYTGYARVAVPRTSAGFTVAANAAALAAAVDFAQMTGGAGGTVTHVGIGCSASGAGKLLYRGAYTPNLAVTVGVIPRINAGTVVTED